MFGHVLGTNEVARTDHLEYRMNLAAVSRKCIVQYKLPGDKACLGKEPRVYSYQHQFDHVTESLTLL